MRFRSKGPSFYAAGRLKTGDMNRMEAEYSAELHLRVLAGDLLWFKFEGIKLRLADNTFYTPDFFVLAANSELQVHECKGYMTDNANVKIKVAAELYPFRFFVARQRLKRDGGGFVTQEIGQ